MNQLNNSLLLVSGGVDSMALLHYMIENKFSFQILHINHLTRPLENEQEYAAIKTIAQLNKIPLSYAEYQHENGNFQAKARKFRYSKAKEICYKYGIEKIVTAHHRDDLVENIMMNQSKIGSRLINEETKYEDIVIYRPLLKFYKKQIYQYASNNNLTYFEDSSNQNPKYKRNYWRLKLAEFSIEAKEKIINTELERINNFPEVPGELTVSYLQQFNQEKQMIILYFWLKQLINTNISQKLLMEIIGKLTNKGNHCFTLPAGFKLFQEYDFLRIESVVESVVTTSKLACVGENEFNGIYFINKIDGAVIRCRKTGDRLEYDTYSKKITRIMIDQKIPKHLRDKWPIVCNQMDQPLYIPKAIKK